MRPQFGNVLFEDDFSTEEGWTITQTDQGSIAYGKSELTIAIGETNEYLYSVRDNPTFTDFYLEITASPSLCRGEDEYGVLFRVTGTMYYYRYSLSCDGQVRLDGVKNEQAFSPQPWLYSGSVPPGAPSSSRLGVLAVGEDMSFYINDQFQFSIQDRQFTSGGLGVFARSVNKEAVTINFSDLVVYDIP
jgi:hypothetical protein